MIAAVDYFFSGVVALIVVVCGLIAWLGRKYDRLDLYRPPRPKSLADKIEQSSPSRVAVFWPLLVAGADIKKGHLLDVGLDGKAYPVKAKVNNEAINQDDARAR